MATDTRVDSDIAGLSESMGRAGINGGDDGRVGPDGEPAPRTDEEYAQAQMTLRAIVSSKEAGVIIGKAGKNVADLRDETGVKAGVSKVVQGVHDRVLTVTGGLDQISKAYSMVCKALLEGAPQMGMGGTLTNGTHRKYTNATCVVPNVPNPINLLTTISQLFACSSHIIRWVQSSVVKDSRSSISKMSRACGWSLRKRCCHNLQSG